MMHFVVHVGPGHSTVCTILGEIFVPTAASASSPDPVILTTNGFGGSYADQVPLAQYAAPRGYVVLTYSGLGFGGSGCNIELDSPIWDGEAASQLISWLSYRPEVLKDGPADPRVGMIGGSYGGGVQFSTAAIDPRVDTIIPIITWNDLAYSLAPDNGSAAFHYTDNPPGVLKWQWTSLFTADGLSEAPQNPSSTPVPPSSCPGFDPRICEAYAESAALGYPPDWVVSMLRSDSMASFAKHVRIPVMLMQGEGDTLFNINEAVANYNDLRANGDPVKLVIQSWGHSNSTPAPGELSYTSAAHGYETSLIIDWFAKYLKHQNVSTGPAVEYFRPWVAYNTGGSAEPAYGTASSWPVGGTLDLYLSGDGSLVRSAQDVSPGSKSFVNPPGAQPGSYSETSGVQNMSPFSNIGPTDPPGTYASFETPPLPASIDSVGIPVVRFRLTAATASSLTPADQAVLFGKIYDVAPSGAVTLVENLVSPTRIAVLPGQQRLVTMTLPGIVHRYVVADRIELVIAATDHAYLGSRIPDALTISVNPVHPTALSLPVVSPQDETSGGPRATSATIGVLPLASSSN